MSQAPTWPPSDTTWRVAVSPGRDEPATHYELRFHSAARRAIAERLPEAVAAAVLEFCEAVLAVNPQRVGKPLFGPLAGCHGARRGTYRTVYRIDGNARVVHLLDIAHRSGIYRR